MKISRIAAGAIAALVTFAATGAETAEPDTRSPLDRYQGDSQFSMLMCSMTVKMAATTGSGPSTGDEKTDYVACVSKGKATAKANFESALKTLKKPKAREALKSYHVALVAALEGIKPGTDERKISYEQRQQALEQKMTEAWARFEIEK
ncbi:hypothetical protein [Pelomonas sp. SE-A7]|uniref:hypothetical protein n=1 Tax=Pelomonas sp. SE-A7 TaxID=3054953 RepID=UPI00259CAF2E|nr:hypothetical protein [Pelomonas sp. SE-A7]MDM4767277.1 hypothetical protein [Pelomonas sp. SE-A7]